MEEEEEAGGMAIGRQDVVVGSGNGGWSRQASGAQENLAGASGDVEEPGAGLWVDVLRRGSGMSGVRERIGMRPVAMSAPLLSSPSGYGCPCCRCEVPLLAAACAWVGIELSVDARCARAMVMCMVRRVHRVRGDHLSRAALSFLSVARPCVGAHW